MSHGQSAAPEPGAASRLAAAIDAPSHTLQSPRADRLSYYADDRAAGRPLVLLHSINAAPSAFEMKPLFDHYRTRRPVYALDLPGFGRSERSDRPYTPSLYADALADFLALVVKRPADVVALSLAAEFAARTVQQAEPRIVSLAMISPTGFGLRNPPGGKTADRLLRVFRLPVFGDGLYRLLTSRVSIRYFLGKGFNGEVPQALIDYAYLTSHQPGASYAPFWFLSMQLFTPDAVARLYRPLQLPVLVLYDRDPNVSFERLEALLSERPNWQAERIQPTLGLPHWERPGATVAALDRFWQAQD
jgi:pimeloyl-ACP methyl ester carboxylesterase